jgi:hypothetical protein
MNEGGYNGKNPIPPVKEVAIFTAILAVVYELARFFY